MDRAKGYSNSKGRRDRLIEEKIHDTYMNRSKPTDPTICPQCRVVFTEDRWQWQPETPKGAIEALCPACQRIQDNFPAGILTLSGEFFAEHRSEILALLHNKVEGQKAQHPMKRLMEIKDQDDGSAVITFTDTHLPRGVGQAIESAYSGNLDIQYTDEANLVRVYWQR